MHMFGENSSYVTIFFIFKLDRSDQNLMETLEMALLFWNYLFPETHVADQLDWKQNSSVVDSRLGFNNLIQFEEKIQNFYLYVQFYG
jgi:hypothetical protein